MIRFVDLGDQIFCDDDVKTFAWFDTISQEFISFNSRVIFNSWQEFENAYMATEKDYPLERFKELFPNDF